MVISIEHFSRNTVEGVRRWLAEHPPVEIRVTRKVFDMASTPLRIAGGVCECGFIWVPEPEFVDSLSQSMKALGEELPRGSLPEDFFSAIEVKHAWDKESRSQYCGKLLTLQTVPI